MIFRLEDKNDFCEKKPAKLRVLQVLNQSLLIYFN